MSSGIVQTYLSGRGSLADQAQSFKSYFALMTRRKPAHPVPCPPIGCEDVKCLKSDFMCNHTRQGLVASLNLSTSSGVSENESAPTFSAACLLFFAPGMGSTFSFSISQRRAT